MNLWLAAGLLACGVLLHFLKKLYDLEQTGTIIWPTTYLRQHPYSFLSSVVGAYLLAAVCYFSGQLTYVTAILIGVICSDAFDTLRARAVGKKLEGYPSG